MMKPADRSEKRGKEPKRKHTVKDFAKDVAFVLVAFFFLNSFVLASFEVPTGSMENEIMAGDFLFVNKYIYGGSTPRTIPLTNIRIPWFRVPAFRDVERGDVIVFEFPGQRDERMSPEFMFYLKRAIALSGDTVLIANRVVYINGEPAPIPRNLKFNSYQVMSPGLADPRIFPKGAPFNEDNWGPVRVPMEGDTLALSPESLVQWKTFIEREGHSVTVVNGETILIDGRPATNYRIESSYILGLGDNRDNSLDCRFWGFIPYDNVVGTPMIVYWSWDPDIALLNLFSKIQSLRLNRLGRIIK